MCFLIILVDIGKETSKISETIQEAESGFGPIFMLVNCAGFAKAAKFEDLSYKEMDVSILFIYYLYIKYWIGISY